MDQTNIKRDSDAQKIKGENKFMKKNRPWQSPRMSILIYPSQVWLQA